MTVHAKDNVTLTLSRLLLRKGLPFCLYRFPGENDALIAVPEDISAILGLKDSGDNRMEFVISPFDKNSSSPQIILRKLPPDFLEEEMVKNVGFLPEKNISWGDLPEAISKETYLDKCGKYLAEIRNTSLSKAILSRAIVVEKPASFDPFAFFQILHDEYPETFVSLFYIPGRGLWAGASPELLVAKDGPEYTTMALAATRPREAGQAYLWRKKEKEEHDMVREHVEEIFIKYGCTLLQSKGPYTIETGRVAHLRTDYKFKEVGENRLADIISALHPTPAIGGLPVEASLACIRRHEGFDRHYYTGYLGETNGVDSSRLFINLRCMQIGQKDLAIFVGGGISADSDPEEEWAETHQKSLTLLEKIDEPIRIHAQ